MCACVVVSVLPAVHDLRLASFLALVCSPSVAPGGLNLLLRTTLLGLQSCLRLCFSDGTKDDGSPSAHQPSSGLHGKRIDKQVTHVLGFSVA